MTSVAHGVLRSHPALDYRAPFVVEKLVRDHVVDSVDEGEALFQEMLRYLVLADVDRPVSWKMYSTRVDEAWHQFVLFTVQYTEFCTEFFGGYRHHAPANAPAPASVAEPASASAVDERTFEQFGERYAEMYGSPLPTIWYDHRTITTRRRLVNNHLGALEVVEDEDGVELIGPSGLVVFEVNRIARDALRFIAAHGTFHVREIPGELTDEEKVALATGLVESTILRVAA
jgi:hypothetical protein